MQKVIRRTVFAEKQVARRLAKLKDKYTRGQAKTQRENSRVVRAEEVRDIKVARQARREDWELGPLAPKRDVGLAKETYGTISMSRVKGEQLNMEQRLKVNPHGGRHATIVVGDRVVLLEGKDKGRIGKVTELDSRRQEVTVEGLNMIDIAVPKWMRTADQQDVPPVQSLPKPISLASVKLIFPMTDPETGVTRDVIVRDIENGRVFYDRFTGKRHWTRMIAGLGTVIPWPQVKPKEHKDYDCDTLRIDLETRTFVPSLLKPPMPLNVIDELRNKYSKFRTRHDDEYIQAKMQEDKEKEEQIKRVREMRTPLNEINKSARQQRKANGKPKLSTEMLEKIGQFIAQKKQVPEEEVVSKVSADLNVV